MSLYVNAAPQVQALGIKDDSIRTLLPEAAALPTHLPKFFIYAQQGPTTPQLVGGDNRLSIYGANSFDENSAFFAHTTRGSNIAAANGNLQMIERVVPADAGPRANIQIWADVCDIQATQYVRAADGSFEVDTNGDKIEDTTLPAVDGVSIRYVVTANTVLEDEVNFGKLTQKTGTTVIDGVTSKLIPIAEFRASSYGQWANLSGVRMWAPTADEVSSKYIKNGAFPFNFAVVTKASKLTTSKPKSTLLGDPQVLFTFDPAFKDPDTGAGLSLSKGLQEYRNVTDLEQPIVMGDFAEVFVYNANVADLTAKMLINETIAVAQAMPDGVDSMLTDLTLGEDSQYLMNILTGKTINGVPYYSVVVDNTPAGSVRMAANSDIMAAGGSDGTMTLEALDAYVQARMADYLDVNNQATDNALSPETFVYDTGFGVQAKYALMNFIGTRKDTNFVGSSFQADEGKVLSMSEELSVMIALKSRLNFLPESTWFGTPVTRAMLVAGSGELDNSNFTGQAALTLQILDYNCKLMGAGDGKWKAEYVYDRWPTNKVTLFKSVSRRFVPVTARNKLWEAGVTWSQAFNLTENFFPAIRSVYENDTSVLTSHLTACGCAALETVGIQIWREFTGSISLTESQFVLRVNKRVEELVSGKFAGLFVIEPNAQITGGDSQRGYSWTLDINLHANNMKTAMRLAIHSKRMSDLK